MNILSLLIAWLVTAVSFLIISKIPLIGVEVDSLNKSFVSAAVLGIVTVLVKPVLGLFFAIPNFLTLTLFQGVFTFIISAICFGIAAFLVQGFRLRYGIWSAIMGALALSVISSLIYSILPV
ncbi:phage holin family protein [Rivularia sp. UHCC 0363]|uniref:phage holin family protein n=1 Tax=Rivularia sp. UHCC 0363 TaxID=3110244 RepID=UPI002B208D6D|nr:phage holin family protein [Rivularia sp. UHCC 0363]MEA5596539.1 phage holin family protein [Rivularia sp. UHCC 0363]